MAPRTPFSGGEKRVDILKGNKVQQEVAQYRITRLFDLAKESLNPKSPMNGLGSRYIRIAEEISSHYRIKIPDNVRLYICRSCHNPLVPGINAKVRVVSEKGYIAYTCACGAERHIFYK